MSAARRFRKKPVVVEAMRYDGPAWLPEERGWRPHSAPEFDALRRFVGSAFYLVHVGTETHGGANQYGPAIRTLEGVMRVSPGDYVIRGVQGEFYPCKPDIFDATYEPAPVSGSGTPREPGT